MSPSKKINEKQKAKIASDLKKGASQRNLANEYDVSKSTIQRIASSLDGVDDHLQKSTKPLIRSGGNESSLSEDGSTVGEITKPSLPNFTRFDELAQYLKLEKTNLSSTKKSDEVSRDNNEISNSMQQSIEPTRTNESANIEDNTDDDGEYLKKYVNWYVKYVDNEKQQYKRKNKELTSQLEVGEKERKILEDELAKKEKKVTDLTGALQAEKIKAGELNKRIKEIEGKRQKFNQLCVRCQTESIFQFQSLSFCSKSCLQETAKSLKSIKTKED